MKGDWLSTKQAAAALGLDQHTIYRLVNAGELTAYKIGRVIRLKRSDTEAYIQAHGIEPGTLDHLARRGRPRK